MMKLNALFVATTFLFLAHCSFTKQHCAKKIHLFLSSSSLNITKLKCCTSQREKRRDEDDDDDISIDV